MANKVVHFEILGRDSQRTIDFYSSLFGWHVDASNPMNYGLVSPDEAGVGGGLAASQEQPVVTVYVEVADLDATLRKVESLGGRTTMPPTEVPGGPKLAQFADPDGNVIGLTLAGSM